LLMRRTRRTRRTSHALLLSKVLALALLSLLLEHLLLLTCLHLLLLLRVHALRLEGSVESAFGVRSEKGEGETNRVLLTLL